MKDSILFNIIYNKKAREEKNEDVSFNNSIENLNRLKIIIENPEKINNDILTTYISHFQNNDELKDEIIRLSKYFLKENIDPELTLDKIIVIKNKKYYIKEIEIILYFLNRIKVKKTQFTDKLTEIIKVMKEPYNYNEIKKQLECLKSLNIFNYHEKNKNLDIYRYLYNK